VLSISPRRQAAAPYALREDFGWWIVGGGSTPSQCTGPIQMAANNSDPIQDQLGEGGAGVRHEAEEEEVGEETSSAAAQATATTMLPRSSSRPQLDLSGAAIHGTLEDRNPTILLPNQSDDISHLALDIGGTCVRRARLLVSVSLLDSPNVINSVYRFVAV
jgi:hypothetical protein